MRRAVLAAAALIFLGALHAGPANAQTGTDPTVRQPTGALVPSPSAVPPARDDDRLGPDPAATGSIDARDTRGLPQSPHNLNVFGCREIDPLCQESPGVTPDAGR
ncbi:hypothetical protein [Aquabacter spiritensis]|uniref:Uncharacterized protein n=1 Tax=Aquabacter spiritensis TaxID=933073 RepID=A0A4R3LVZ9_9HYPH|nr:hypothetical protein [Aquabacter spiritensis]TCT03879.1 hypothetical protein EDC64_10845 [Aquabacter spiritensis]